MNFEGMTMEQCCEYVCAKHCGNRDTQSETEYIKKDFEELFGKYIECYEKFKNCKPSDFITVKRVIAEDGYQSTKVEFSDLVTNNLKLKYLTTDNVERMFVARDLDGDLWLYFGSEPLKDDGYGMFEQDDEHSQHPIKLNPKLFETVNYDNGPIEVVLTERSFRKETVDEEKINEIAIESWERLRQLASAEHVARAWNNYVNGFKAGYKRAKEE